MTINSVGSQPIPNGTNATQSHQTPPASQQKSSSQDTVHLSPAALAAAGDVDHDGDSH